MESQEIEALPLSKVDKTELSVFRFNRDHWELTLVHDLTVGDVVYHQGMLVEMIDKPYLVDGNHHIPARTPTPNPIKLALGDDWGDKRYLAMAMDYVCSGLIEFEDGTALICELEHGPGAIYSPRLPILDLEEFCKTHIVKYEAFFDKNEKSLDKGVVVPMEQWWGLQERVLCKNGGAGHGV